MQLEQPPPDLAVPTATPFDHLRPSLWRASKIVHIVLVSLGTIMLVPAAYVMIALGIAMTYFGGFPSGSTSGMPTEAVIALITAVASSGVGVIAWCALSILFFKRNDARWQRICWGICAAFGVVSSPCIVLWIIYLTQEGMPSEMGWVYLIFFSMLGVALACAFFGFRYSLAAASALKHLPTEEDRSFL